MAKSASKFDLPIDYREATLHGQEVIIRQYHRSYKNRTKTKMTSSSRTMKAPPMSYGQMKQAGIVK